MREPDFELSADMRLLELQRGALGLPPREPLAWESRELDATLPLPDPQERQSEGAVLTIEAVAVPPDGVIAGAVVTCSLSVANEGSGTALDVVVAAPLPGGVAYRPGSFVWNGRSTFDDVAERFFGDGLPVGAIGSSERAGFSWKIGIRLGNKPIAIVPIVRARGSAVIGAKPLHIARKATPASSVFANEVDRAQSASYQPRPLIPIDLPVTDLPIYELDAEEQIVHEAADAALSSAAPKRTPAKRAARRKRKTTTPAPHAIGTPKAAPEVATPTQATAIATPTPQPVAEAPAASLLLRGRFERTTLSFFERVFAPSKPIPILQHCIFGGALACADGGDAALLRAHLNAQSQLLHRIVLHERLGKKEPIAGYAGALVARIEHLAPPPGGTGSSANALATSAELAEPTLAVLRSLCDPSARWDFVKARQFTLALTAQRVAVDDPALAERATQALRAYAQASVTTLQKLFVRIRIDRTTGVLFANEPALDEGARHLLAVFGEIFARY